MMNVPVIAAAGFKGNIMDHDLLCRNRRQITLTHEILRKCVVRFCTDGGQPGQKAADPGRRIRTETAGNSSAIRSGSADIGQCFPRKQYRYPRLSDKKGSSRDLGEVEVDRQGAGKLAVSKHTTTITLLSPCIILILPPSGQVIPSSPKRFLPTITPCLPLSLAPTCCPVVADACNPRH